MLHSQRSLEFLPSEDDSSIIRIESPTLPRPGSSNSRRAPPVLRSQSSASVSSNGSRPLTPTKNFSLKIARKNKTDSSTTSVPYLDWKKYEIIEHERLARILQKRLNMSEGGSDQQTEYKADKKSSAESNTSSRVDSSPQVARTSEAGAAACPSHRKMVSTKNNDLDIVDIDNSDEYDTDLEDEPGAEDLEEADVKPKAPNELFMEFIGCLMEKDYQNATKLCEMVLMYEPDNPEAVSFASLLEEKLELGETDSDSDSDESSDEEDSDESGSEDDSDDDSEDEGNIHGLSQSSSEAESEVEDVSDGAVENADRLDDSKF